MKKIILLIALCSISLFSCKSGGETNNDKEKELLEREKALLEKENASLKDNNQKSSEQSSQNRPSREQASPKQESQHPQPNFSYNNKYISYNHNGSGINEYIFMKNETPFYYSPKKGTYMQMFSANCGTSIGSRMLKYQNDAITTNVYKFAGSEDCYGILVLNNGTLICVDSFGDEQTYLPF